MVYVYLHEWLILMVHVGKILWDSYTPKVYKTASKMKNHGTGKVVLSFWRPVHFQGAGTVTGGVPHPSLPQ